MDKCPHCGKDTDVTDEDTTIDFIVSKKNTHHGINFVDYPAASWAVRQVLRASGLVEDICKHGVGHPNRTWLRKHDPYGKKGFGVHGCDGCCHGRE